MVHRAFSNVIRQIGQSRSKYPLVTKRAASTKHPEGFVAPSSEDLLELRERVQEFTSRQYFDMTCLQNSELIDNIGREIPEDLAAKTDRENEFPLDMWRKLGDAGYSSPS